MRNYQKYYYDLMLSTSPEDVAITHSLRIYYSFYNKNGKFSETKFNGYLKAGLEIFNMILDNQTLKDKYTEPELQAVIQQKEQSEYILTLSSKEKEKIVEDTIEEVTLRNTPLTTVLDPKDDNLSLCCPNCGGTKFKTNVSQDIFHCINCNNTYSKEELIKGNGYGREETA